MPTIAKNQILLKDAHCPRSTISVMQWRSGLVGWGVSRKRRWRNPAGSFPFNQLTSKTSLQHSYIEPVIIILFFTLSLNIYVYSWNKMKGETPDSCSDADEAPPLGTFSKDLTRVPGRVIGKKGILKKQPIPWNTTSQNCCLRQHLFFFIFQIKFKQPMGSATLWNR